MGSLNSRRPTMDNDDGDDSGSRIEDTSDDTDTLDSDSDYGENFVAMLRTLISNGQFMLQDNEIINNRAFRKTPKIKGKPDTTTLDQSEFSLITQRACGLLEPEPFKIKSKNLTTLLMNREVGLYTTQNFSQGLKRKITNDHLPNELSAKISYGMGKVFCGIFSGDGNTFLTASQDRHIRLFNARDCSYRMFSSIKARDIGWSILDVAFSPDGENFVYSTWSTSLHMCSVHGKNEHQEPLHLLSTNRRFCVFSVVYSLDGRELMCGANDGSLYFYDIERKRRSLKIPAHEYDVNTVLFADQSSDIIYSGADDGLVKIWDRRILRERNAQPVGMLAGHMGGITFIDSRYDGRHLISNSKDQTIKLWDVRKLSSADAVSETTKAVSGQLWDYRWHGVPVELYKDQKLQGDTSVMTYRGHVVSKTLIRARFSPVETTGQRYIYTGCNSGRVVIYDALTGQMVKFSNKGHLSCVRDVSWHPHRNEILSSSWDGSVSRWIYNRIDPVEKSKDNTVKRPLRRSARLAAQRRQDQSTTD